MHGIDDIINWKKIHLIYLFKIDTHSCNCEHIFNIYTNRIGKYGIMIEDVVMHKMCFGMLKFMKTQY